jgi:hypothetical protein
VSASPVEVVERFFAVVDRDECCLALVVLEDFTDQQLVARIVFDEQDRSVGHGVHEHHDEVLVDGSPRT